MNISDAASLIALALSAVAIFQTYRANKDQSRLTDREVELVRRQLDQLERDDRASKTADISARIYKESKNNWKLRIANKGPAVAENVYLNILAADRSMFNENFISDKLPMKRMEKGDSVDITAIITSGTNIKEEVELCWDDPSEVGKKKKVEVSI